MAAIEPTTMVSPPTQYQALDGLMVGSASDGVGVPGPVVEDGAPMAVPPP